MLFPKTCHEKNKVSHQNEPAMNAETYLEGEEEHHVGTNHSGENYVPLTDLSILHSTLTPFTLGE